MWEQLLEGIRSEEKKALARSISFVENEVDGYENFLSNLPKSNSIIIGITGPPGAGKSTLANALIELVIQTNKKVGILCIDPSSPFNYGALLGDRIRMNQWYNNPNVYIRSLAARGSLGGLHPNIIEITEVMKSFGFDYVIIETVGVGQSEVEIAGLADVTVITLSPESGDDIQTMKAGIMEIADIFVVNKADRPEANNFVASLKAMIVHSSKENTPVIKTVASQNVGIDELLENIISLRSKTDNSLQYRLYAEKVFRLIQKHRMKDIDIRELQQKIEDATQNGNTNLFAVVRDYTA
ncbi:MAG TPA: methylmalonyl Co-A mutase-associated GTPase MeaB [Segetibacter sp.]